VLQVKLPEEQGVQRSVAKSQDVHPNQRAWHNAVMAHPRKPRQHDSTVGSVSGEKLDQDAHVGPIDPRAFGLGKAAYAVGETLNLLSIGRTSLYAAVKRGDLKRVKFGKKTLFYAADLAAFLTKLRRLSEENNINHAQRSSKISERS
jgi:excisionase family DNA binding protein